jgi:uncharacterized repeat protein (TIGR01451 family)/MYXO-CTERM domain-containing protein
MAAKIRNFSLGPVAVGLILLAATPAQADPILRHQADARGDVRVFGSTLAFDCGSAVAAPAGSTVSCGGQQNIIDTAGDIYWRDSIADTSVEPSKARTSATLDLPAGSTITYARLYWSALKVGPDPDTKAELDFVGGPLTTINSDHCHPVVQFPFASHPEWYYYQCSGDATAYVANWGAGDFRVTDVDAIPLKDILVHVSYSAWTLVVFYENANDELRNMALFDGFEMINPEHTPPSVTATLSGFLVPNGFEAKMTAFMYEGDILEAGVAPPNHDRFMVNGFAISSPSNPVDDFFNSSRTFLGTPYSGNQDVPKLSGVPGSMAGYDLHTVDVTEAMKAGDTSATISAESAYDKFLLGGFVTSIKNKAPDFNNMIKEVVDLNGGGVMPNDILEYTISAENTGNDAAINAVMTDDLEPGIAFVPGTIQIVSGGVVGVKTDQPGDDQGEFANGRVTVRVGSGATATKGGTVAVNEKVVVKFRVRVTATKGEVANKAILKASGQSGGTEKTYESDGDVNQLGKQPTVVVVNECNSDDDCSGLKPHCDLSSRTCVGCKTDADCKDPANPACQPSGACGQCSATNDVLCTGGTPVCETTAGVCVLCTQGPGGDATMCENDPNGPVCMSGSGGSLFCGCITDSDCGSLTSGRVCDTSVQLCIDGCRGKGGNGCPTELVCTSPDTTIGDCITGSGGAGGAGGVGGAGGGITADPDEAGDDGGCACSTAGNKGWGGAMAGLFALGAIALMRRRRC